VEEEAEVMPQHRYQPLDAGHPDDENTMPLDTQLTILTRQSTFKQTEKNVYSTEANPKDLIREGQRLGFTDIRVYDWDTGIGAYSTTIEERPGLQHWLFELLPSGASRALLVSQEDRLFRDRWETQHNRFIEQVAKHHGWVICGQRIYNFRREMDCEQFRLACKYGRLYIEHHVKGRLHPAVHRTAMSGRYAGGPVQWGYIVDYDPHSPTYKYFVRYEPHAVLVVEHVFRRFSRMPRPSVMELARTWEREGRVWPYFGPEVDERRVRILKQAAARSAGAEGYRFHYRQAQRILTDVTYLGWRVHRGEVAWDEVRHAPKVCHEPLVDDDLFWWCHDHIEPERPPFAPARPMSSAWAVSTYRPHHSHHAGSNGVPFLVPGRVRCAAHGSRYAAVHDADNGFRLCCPSLDKLLSDAAYTCPVVGVADVEQEVVAAFLEQLVLDERDVHHLAQLAARRGAEQPSAIVEFEKELAELRAGYERAKRRALQVEDDGVAADFLAEARTAKARTRELEQRLVDARRAQAPTKLAHQQAEQACDLARRIHATFAQWPRHAQAPVLAMALEGAVLGPVHRRLLGLYLRWQGGTESRREIVRALGQHIRWSSEEVEALRRYYDALTWEALRAMLPGRSADGIETHAQHLGLVRRRGRVIRSAVAPCIVRRPEITNLMASYGFQLAQAAEAEQNRIMVKPATGASSGPEPALSMSPLVLRRRS